MLTNVFQALLAPFTPNTGQELYQAFLDLADVDNTVRMDRSRMRMIEELRAGATTTHEAFVQCFETWRAGLRTERANDSYFGPFPEDYHWDDVKFLWQSFQVIAGQPIQAEEFLQRLADYMVNQSEFLQSNFDVTLLRQRIELQSVRFQRLSTPQDLSEEEVLRTRTLQTFSPGRHSTSNDEPNKRPSTAATFNPLDSHKDNIEQALHNKNTEQEEGASDGGQ